MDLRRESRPAGPVVTGFSGRQFRVGDTIHPRGLLLDPDGVTDWDSPADITLIDLPMVGKLVDFSPAPEFLLLGTGARLVQPPRAFVRAIESRGIGVEVMDSRAAARTWGVLRAEGRRIVAALMPL